MKIELKDKLLKLYELAKRGVGGEKTNAERFLNNLLEKHGLSIDDIDQELPKKRYYRYTTNHNEMLIAQVILKVTNNKQIWNVKHYKELAAEVTDYQHVQILELIDFHLDNYNQEKKIFLKDFTVAYVQKHKLFRDAPDERELKDLTQEEKEALWRMSNLKQNLSNKSYTKKLEI